MSEDRDKYAGTHLGAGFCFPTFKSVMVEFKMPDFELFTYFNRMRAASETHVFFLESRTEKSDARYSLLGCRPLLVMEDRQGRVEVTGESLDYQSIDSDIFSMQRAFLDSQKVGTGVRDQGFFPGGLVGYWGYDQALRSPDIGYRSREVSLPPADQPYGSGAGGRDSRAARFPESACFFPGLVVVQDRRTSIVRVYGFYRVGGEGEAAARKQVRDTVAAIKGSGPSPVPIQKPIPVQGTGDGFVSSTGRSEFMGMVSEAREYIRRGEVLQVVVSQRWKKDTPAVPEAVYAELRSMNPSPYMFYLRFPEFTLLGSSPEMLVKVEESRVRMRPIAGTRPVTGDMVRDAALRRELVTDRKEQAEHLMLVDLGCEDMARISRPGTVKVKEFMKLEAYSHVVHLVSEIEGQLTTSEDSLSALQSCFPAGTVTGAPKRRAMEIIDRLEKYRRGPYGGAVGYLSLDGSLDACITIRSLLFHQGCCYLQAGAGVVAESVPEQEYEETVNKARGMMAAVLRAEVNINEGREILRAAGEPGSWET